MTGDVKFVYYLMEAFYPYYDEHNDSNFSFLPITWTNNLLQDWSGSAGFDVVDSSNSTTDARLSCPKKSESGRKKVLILVVNKQDRLEPGELTYLGFNNDYAEIPAVDGDCISFTANYSDSS